MQGVPADAVAHIKVSLSIREAASDENRLNAGARGELADAYAAMGEALAAMGRTAEAVDWHQRARDIYAELDSKKQLNASTQELFAAVKKDLARLTAAR